jgi:phi LC3 family holin
MKKINWLVRIKNPMFWLTIIPAIATTVYTVLALFDIVPTISEETFVNAGVAIVSILSTVGVLVDPTTKGLSDSEQAMTYTEPKK